MNDNLRRAQNLLESAQSSGPETAKVLLAAAQVRVLTDIAESLHAVVAALQNAAVTR